MNNENLTPFKKGQSEKYSKDEGIVFNINGQAHGFIPKSFFVRRKRLRLGYIYESILILVDCSNLDHRSREDLFMNSRDRLSNIELRTEILKSIEDILKNHQGLIQLNMRRREEEIKNKLSDSKPLVEILERILEKSPTLSKLFIKGQRLSNPFNIEIKGSENDFIGRRFPTFFTLIKKHPISSPKNCHIGSQFRIQFSTDADNDYFERDSEKGNYEVTCDDMNVINSTLNLWQGIATLSVFPPQDSFCGQILHYSLKVSDNSRVEPFLEDFYISLLDPSEKIPGGKGKRQKTNKKDGNNSKGPSKLNLPNIIEVYNNDWDNYEFNKESALLVKDAGEGWYDFYINMDNIHLMTEKKDLPNIEPKLVDARYKYGMVLIGLAVIRDYEENETPSEETDIDVSKRVREISKVLSPFLLPMIASLGELEIDEIETELSNEN